MKRTFDAIRPRAIIFYGGFFARAGGAFKHAETIVRELGELGWEVRLISLDSIPTPAKYLPHLTERIVNLWYMPLGFHYKGWVTRLLFRLLAPRGADLYIFEDIYLAWNSKVPSISVLHAVWSDNLQAFAVDEPLVQRLVRKEASTIRRIEHPVVTVSAPYCEFLYRHFAGTAVTKKIGVVELGLDFSAIPTRRSAWDPDKLIYCGALEARKNVRFMLEVFRRISAVRPAVTLTVIGNGPEQASLEKFAADHDLKVDFRGRCSHAVVIAELQKHSVYLHTSTKESFSFSLLEAKLCGLTTCALACLEVPADFIDEPMAGLNPDEWAARIIAIRSPTQAKDLSRFTARRMAERTLQAAGLVTSGAGQPGGADSPVAVKNPSSSYSG